MPIADVRLRMWRGRDADQVAAAAADPQIANWNPMRPPAADEWCAARADWSHGAHASWAVVDIDADARVLGSVSLFQIDRDQRGCEVGFWVAPDARRRGVATAGLRLATDYAFTELQLRRVTLFHAVENPGSCGAAAAAGYPLEGVHRQSYRYGDGVWHDEHSHARLASD